MKTVVIIYLTLVVLAMTACGKSQEQRATVPTIDAQCVSNPALCQPNVYNSPGYTPYPYGNTPYGGGYYNHPNYNYGYGQGYQTGYGGSAFYYMNNSAYLCNCPIGSVPTYNNYGGLGCVQTAQVYGYGYAYFGWGANNNQWTNIPQISNHQGYSQSGCYNGVVQSCIVDQPQTCAVGYSCRASSAASRVGLCVSNTAQGSPGDYGPGVR